MEHTWANPQKEWAGFHLTAYGLDPGRVLELPIIEERTVAGKVDEFPTTIGEIYKRLADRHLEIDPPAACRSKSQQKQKN